MFKHAKNEYRKNLIFKDTPNKIKDVTALAKFVDYDHVARFFISEKPFTELVEGQVRERKGWIMCLLTDPQNKNTNEYLGVGFAFCSPSDEWDVNEGMVKAFVDAVGDLLYRAKKEVLDNSIPHIMKLSVLPTTTNKFNPANLGFDPPNQLNVNQQTNANYDHNKLMDALREKLSFILGIPVDEFKKKNYLG